MTKSLKEINASLEKSIRALLEVPENTKVEDIETFLKPYQFEILNKDQPHSIKNQKTKVYVIRGSKPDYNNLEGKTAGTGYKLELDVKLKPC